MNTEQYSSKENEQKIADAKNKVELEEKLNAVERTHLLNQEEMEILRDSLLMRQEERQTAHDISRMENQAKIDRRQYEIDKEMNEYKYEAELNAIRHANAMKAEELKGRAMRDEYRDRRREVNSLRRLELYPELESVSIERIKTFNELYDKVLAKDIVAGSLNAPSYDYASQVIALSSIAEIETYYSLYIFLNEEGIRKDDLTFGKMVDKIANNSFKYNKVVPEIPQILAVLWNLIKTRNKATHAKTEICDKATFIKFYETFLCFYDYIPVLLKLKKQNRHINC